MSFDTSKIKPRDNKDTDTGILFSIVYLWLEVKRQKMPKTTAGLETLIDLYFEDMRYLGKSDANYVQLQLLLKKMMLLDEKEVTAFLQYVVKGELDIS